MDEHTLGFLPSFLSFLLLHVFSDVCSSGVQEGQKVTALICIVLLKHRMCSYNVMCGSNLGQRLFYSSFHMQTQLSSPPPGKSKMLIYSKSDKVLFLQIVRMQQGESSTCYQHGLGAKYNASKKADKRSLSRVQFT